ncbi:MAG: hypothetical protein WBD37_08950 [Anderseniella sp.]
MTNRFFLFSLAMTALVATTPAMAAEICGAEATQRDGAMVVNTGGFEAMCVPGSKCSIAISTVEDVQISLERASVDGSWLALVASGSSIDTGAGFDLVFNQEDETRIAPDFLIAAEDMKSARVDDEVSEVVVSTMLQSQTMQATIQLIGGKRIVHEVKLENLDKAQAWVDCAQAK